jgi:hypothetical protein
MNSFTKRQNVNNHNIIAGVIHAKVIFGANESFTNGN